MALEGLSLEQIEQELVRRKTAAVEEIRAELEAARKTVRDLEVKLKDATGTAQKPSKGPRASKSVLSAGERAERILAALEGQGAVSAETLAGIVGFDGAVLRGALSELALQKKVVKSGVAARLRQNDACGSTVGNGLVEGESDGCRDPQPQLS